MLLHLRGSYHCSGQLVIIQVHVKTLEGGGLVSPPPKTFFQIKSSDEEDGLIIVLMLKRKHCAHAHTSQKKHSDQKKKLHNQTNTKWNRLNPWFQPLLFNHLEDRFSSSYFVISDKYP